MKLVLPGLIFLALSGCVEEPTPQQADKTIEAIEQDAVKKRQLSIEEAAEEATKLIEADAKSEIDAATATIAVPNSDN